MHREPAPSPAHAAQQMCWQPPAPARGAWEAAVSALMQPRAVFCSGSPAGTTHLGRGCSTLAGAPDRPSAPPGAALQPPHRSCLLAKQRSRQGGLGTALPEPTQARRRQQRWGREVGRQGGDSTASCWHAAHPLGCAPGGLQAAQQTRNRCLLRCWAGSRCTGPAEGRGRAPAARLALATQCTQPGSDSAGTFALPWPAGLPT